MAGRPRLDSCLWMSLLLPILKELICWDQFHIIEDVTAINLSYSMFYWMETACTERHTKTWCLDSDLGVPGWRQTTHSVPCFLSPLPLPHRAWILALINRNVNLPLTNMPLVWGASVEQNTTMIHLQQTGSEQALQKSVIETFGFLLSWEYTVQNFLKAHSQDLLTCRVTFRIYKLCKFKL